MANNLTLLANLSNQFHVHDYQALPDYKVSILAKLL